eukprot:TRINITY_DN20230_c0_g1_i1.p1 TRINITY_DN20230_c0_g1~~TRINITY_DN20230_c0_g1_i1.p1  ORF type:complete len:366 (-),score=110.72 TRINITY_DN20230_c0_g1_i1:232-1329(-)
MNAPLWRNMEDKRIRRRSFGGDAFARKMKQQMKEAQEASDFRKLLAEKDKLTKERRRRNMLAMGIKMRRQMMKRNEIIERTRAEKELQLLEQDERRREVETKHMEEQSLLQVFRHALQLERQEMVDDRKQFLESARGALKAHKDRLDSIERTRREQQQMMAEQARQQKIDQQKAAQSARVSMGTLARELKVDRECRLQEMRTQLDQLQKGFHFRNLDPSNMIEAFDNSQDREAATEALMGLNRDFQEVISSTAAPSENIYEDEVELDDIVEREYKNLYGNENQEDTLSLSLEKPSVDKPKKRKLKKRKLKKKLNKDNSLILGGGIRRRKSGVGLPKKSTVKRNKTLRFTGIHSKKTYYPPMSTRQ